MSPGVESSAVFKDHFSDNSADYATYRPAYPEELFAWLAAQATGRERAWNLDRLEGYLATWSAVKAYRRAAGQDPLQGLRPRLESAWLASGVSLATPKNIKWPLSLRLGRI
jgi:hypothetical protein